MSFCKYLLGYISGFYPYKVCVYNEFCSLYLRIIIIIVVVVVVIIIIIVVIIIIVIIIVVIIIVIIIIIINIIIIIIIIIYLGHFEPLTWLLVVWEGNVPQDMLGL